MRIGVVIPTYHRPRQVTTVISALFDSQSGQHQVEFAIGVDSDDHAGRLALEGLIRDGLPVTVVSRPAAPTLGEKTNSILRAVQADAYAWLADDVVPMTQHWDVAIASVFEKHGFPAFCWQELNDINNTTYPVVRDSLLEALDRRLFCEWFPFWFVDTWLAEVYYLAFGCRLAIVKGLSLGGRRGYPGMAHDLRFWFRFFALTRRDRVAEAQRVAYYFGLAVDVRRDRCDALVECTDWDAMQAARIPSYEESLRSAMKDLPPRYWIARARAEAHLAELETLGPILNANP